MEINREVVVVPADAERSVDSNPLPDVINGRDRATLFDCGVQRKKGMRRNLIALK